MLFCENSLQFTVVNNFDKKLHFQICYVVLNLPCVFFQIDIYYWPSSHYYWHFWILMERQLCTQMSVWQQEYHNNVCHVVWKFWLTFCRSLHFFLGLLLLTLNIICLLWMLHFGKPKAYIFSYNYSFSSYYSP